MADGLFDRLSPSLTVCELPGSDERVSLHALANEVARLFEQSPDSVGVIVVDGDSIVGVIPRAAFLERLSHPYALELDMKRPLTNMLDIIDVEPQIVPADCGVHKAAAAALYRPASRVFAPVLMADPRGGVRLLDVHTLLLAQSRLLELANAAIREAKEAREAFVEVELFIRQLLRFRSSSARSPADVPATSSCRDFP
jgi:hypothetical protein